MLKRYEVNWDDIEYEEYLIEDGKGKYVLAEDLIETLSNILSELSYSRFSDDYENAIINLLNELKGGEE